MQSMKNILTSTFLIFCFVYAHGQVDDHTIRQQVLEKGIIDSLFVFGRWDTSGNTETHLKYLGAVTTANGKVYKVVTSSFFWGQFSQHATSRILIFNNNNQYLGDYYLTVIYDLPEKLVKGKLIFNNAKRNGCDKNLVTEVDLKNGLPKSFFLKCKGEKGDIYTFASI
jgi:hypothetical protein